MEIKPQIKHQKDKLLSNFGFSKSGEYGLNEEFRDEKQVEKFSKFIGKQYELFLCYFIRKDKTERYTWFSINEEFTEERSSSDWNKLKMFQSYMYVSYEPHIWMKAAFDWLADTTRSKEDFPTNFLQKLKEIDNERHGKLPSLDEFKYENVGNYWFRRLDYYLWEEIFNGKSHGELALEDNKNFQFPIEKKDVCGKFVFRNNSPSVEHLHPQDESQSNDKWNSKSDIDGFGNLALISQGLNSYQSNKPVEEKFGKLENILNSSNGILDSVKLYLMYMSAKANQSRWTSELAKAHGEKMIEFLKKTLSLKQQEQNS